MTDVVAPGPDSVFPLSAPPHCIAAPTTLVSEHFLSHLCHALRTPLTAVLGYLDLVQGEGEEQPATIRREYLRRAQASSASLISLLDAVAELSQLQHHGLALDPCPTCVPTLLKGLLDGLRIREEYQHVRISLAPVSDEVTLLTDKACLSRALTHLMSNACRYTPQGGCVRLSAYAQGDQVLISVEDSGLGIPEDEWPLVSTPFYRGSNARSVSPAGVGLGLAIARRLLELLGGELTFCSEAGKGSIFTVHLPSSPHTLPRPASEDPGR